MALACRAASVGNVTDLLQNARKHSGETIDVTMPRTNLREVRVEHGKFAVENYHSPLTTEDAKEQSRWADFAVREFSNQPA